MPIALGLVALLTTALPAQQGAGAVTLPPANARPSTEFSDLTSIRELRDGRVLVFDRKENWLAVVNMADGAMKQISRYGRGPGEFEGTLAIFPLGGDSTLASDGLRRWLIIVGDSVVATLPPDNPGVQAVSLWPLGVDRRGNVLTRVFSRDLAISDSQPVALVNRTDGRADIVARLHSEARKAPIRVVNGSEQVGRPFRTAEAALLLPDGWLAVARLEPYRVDWRSPDGAWMKGPAIRTPAVRMNARERQAYTKRNAWARYITDWPELLPPFDVPTALFSTPDGWLVIKRLSSAAENDHRYDLVDKSGVRRGQLSLRPNEAIIGFGVASVYVIETDDDGIQRLRRHPYAATAIRP
jgi:hypothetical protein